MKAYFLAGCVCFAIWCAVVSGLCALVAYAVTDDWSFWQAIAFATATGLLFVPYVTVLAYRESKIRTHDQEVIATVASEALRTGRPVVAFIDDEGNLRMRLVESSETKEQA